MSASKTARAAKAAAERRRLWYVMTSRMGRETGTKRERETGPARKEKADIERTEETNAEV